MLLADGIGGAVIATIPLLYWTGSLTLPVLVVVAFAVGGLFPAHNASQSLLLARLVDNDERRLIRAGGLLGAFNETASFVGPAIGGMLVALLGAAPVLLLDSASYVASLLLVASSVPTARSAVNPPTDRTIRAGLRYVRQDRVLVRTIAGLGLVELAFTALVATLPVVARVRFDAGAALAGWLLASYGAGSVAGGLLSARARSTRGGRTTIAIVGLAVSTWPLLAHLPSYGVAVAIAANGVCSGLFFPRFFASVTLRTPEPLRARVMTTVTTAISATGPIGFAAAGLLLGHASVTATYAVIAASATIGAGIVVAASATDIRIRPLDVRDAAAAGHFLELQRAAYQVEARLVGSHAIPPLRESLAELLRCGETFLGAYLGRELVGGVSWKFDGETIDLHRLVVDPRHFRRRIGTALLRAALAETPRAARAIVQTGAANEPATALYRSEGFVLVDEIEPAIGLRVAQFTKALR
jgi:ribosomal protein S18 acetylase RimI-like enzyme